jgi:hypothetical protein
MSLELQRGVFITSSNHVGSWHDSYIKQFAKYDNANSILKCEKVCSEKTSLGVRYPHILARTMGYEP